MTHVKLTGILNRLNSAPKHLRAGVQTEFDAAIDEMVAARVGGKSSPANTITTLRDSLTWPEVKDSPLAVARICRTLRKLREGLSPT